MTQFSRDSLSREIVNSAVCEASWGIMIDEVIAAVVQDLEKWQVFKKWTKDRIMAFIGGEDVLLYFWPATGRVYENGTKEAFSTHHCFSFCVMNKVPNPHMHLVWGICCLESLEWWRHHRWTFYSSQFQSHRVVVINWEMAQHGGLICILSEPHWHHCWQGLFKIYKL